MEERRPGGMKSVNVAALKNRLSFYLTKVKAGEEIVVRDRNTPVARLVPLSGAHDDDDELLALAAQGKVRLGKGAIDESFWKLPAPKVPVRVLRRVVQEERDEE
jgi:prevent-host-death family protein